MWKSQLFHCQPEYPSLKWPENEFLNGCAGGFTGKKYLHTGVYLMFNCSCTRKAMSFNLHLNYRIMIGQGCIINNVAFATALFLWTHSKDSRQSKRRFLRKLSLSNCCRTNLWMWNLQSVIFIHFLPLNDANIFSHIGHVDTKLGGGSTCVLCLCEVFRASFEFYFSYSQTYESEQRWV